MSNLVHNEQVKLEANFLNALGIVSMTTGVIIPLLSLFLVADIFEHRTLIGALISIILGGGLGRILFGFAIYRLKDLRE